MGQSQHPQPIPGPILRDTREQRPWTFDDCPVETRDVTLSTGDYTLPTHCTHDPDTDTYHPEFAIERKSGHDFLNAITWDRDRFTAELRRATAWSRPLPVVVEASWTTLLRERGCMRRRSIHPNQIVGTVSAWTRHYNVTFRFTTDRQRAKQCALLILVRHALLRRLDTNYRD